MTHRTSHDLQNDKLDSIVNKKKEAAVAVCAKKNVDMRKNHL